MDEGTAAVFLNSLSLISALVCLVFILFFFVQICALSVGRTGGCGDGSSSGSRWQHHPQNVRQRSEGRSQFEGCTSGKNPPEGAKGMKI